MGYEVGIFIGKNSWGEGWGFKGHYKMDAEHRM